MCPYMSYVTCACDVHAGFWGRSRWRAGQQQLCQGTGGLRTSAGGWRQQGRGKGMAGPNWSGPVQLLPWALCQQCCPSNASAQCQVVSCEVVTCMLPYNPQHVPLLVCVCVCHAGFWGRSWWRAGQQQHCQGTGGLHTSAGGWQQHERAWLSQLNPVCRWLLRAAGMQYRCPSHGFSHRNGSQARMQPTAVSPAGHVGAEFGSHVSHVCS
jgi:hypothetical protein